MSISNKDVEHIAHLARIELTPEEIKKFELDLSSILNFIETMSTLDTSDITPVRGGTLLSNETRKDEMIDDNIEHKHASLVEALPKKKDNWAKVKAIFD